MSKRVLSLADRKRLRDEAIVDFRHGFINRREFMLRATAAGVSDDDWPAFWDAYRAEHL